MKKNYIFIPLAIICLLAVAGCAVNNQANNSDKNAGMQRNQEQLNNQNQLQKWQENFDEASSTEITIGSKVLVMGSENADGTVSADRIIIEGLPAQAGGTRNGNGRKGGTKMARLNGEIISKDDISITLKLADGGSKLVFLSGSTAIMKAKKKSE